MSRTKAMNIELRQRKTCRLTLCLTLKARLHTKFDAFVTLRCDGWKKVNPQNSIDGSILWTLIFDHLEMTQ